MGVIHKTTKIVRRPVETRRGKEIDAVIAPAEAAREICHGHDFNHRDAQRRQLCELTPGSSPRPFLGERANVHLVHYLPFKAHARPRRIGPCKSCRVDDLRGSMGSFGLEARRRIWIMDLTAIEAIPVQCPGSRLGHRTREVPIFFGYQGHMESTVMAHLTSQHYLYPLAAWRPDTEVDATFREYCCADRQTPRPCRGTDHCGLPELSILLHRSFLWIMARTSEVYASGHGRGASPRHPAFL